MPPKPTGNVGRGVKRQKPSILEPPPPEGDIFMGLKKLNDSQKKKWKKLDHHKRKLHITRFLDIDLLDVFGFGIQVRQLMKQTGLEKFVGKSAAVYKRYTLEFLSTFEQVEVKGVPSIRFQLNDQKKTLSYAEVRELFGVSDPAGEFKEKDQMAAIFFFELTGRTFARLNNTAANLTHPAWRLFYRALSMTFLGKGEPAKLNTFDVAMMRTALPSSTTIPDWVDAFFVKCATYASQGYGNIPVGGMITLLVEKFTRDHPDEVGLIEGPYYFDEDYICRYDGFSTLPPIYGAALKFTYGDTHYMICKEGATFPMGPAPRDWRMVGVVDIEDREVVPVEGDGDEEVVRTDKELDDQAAGSSAFRNDQLQEMMRMQQARYDYEDRVRQDRYALEDRRWEETCDRLEAIEDEVTTISKNQSHMMMWMQQSEPRDLPPVPAQFSKRMADRKSARGQRHETRRAQIQSEGSNSQATWQWPPQ